MPSETRVTPSSRISAAFEAVTVRGFASIVNSTTSDMSTRSRKPRSRRSRCTSLSIVGVPPPKKIVFGFSGCFSASFSSASTNATMSVPPGVCL
jgi:hypothetical protein